MGVARGILQGPSCFAAKLDIHVATLCCIHAPIQEFCICCADLLGGRCLEDWLQQKRLLPSLDTHNAAAGF